MEIVSIVLTEEAAGSHEKLRELYDAAVASTLQDGTRRSLKVVLHQRNLAIRKEISGHWSSIRWTRRDFEEGVRKVQDYVKAGDCYQAVI